MRIRRSRLRVGLAVLGILLVAASGLLVLFGAVALLLYDQDEPFGVRLAMSAVVALFGAGILLLAYWGYRSWWPRRARHLQLAVEPTELRRGDHVEVTLTLLNPRRVGKRLELGLVCSELYETRVATGSGGATASVAEHAEHEEWREAPRDEHRQHHRFLVPASAPYSHRGKALSFSWRVTAREPTRFRFDPSVSEEIEVRP